MTIGLAIITNSGPEAKRIVKDYSSNFDMFYITVADKDKKLYEQLKTFYEKDPKVDISYFKWVDHFGKARQYNRSRIKTDYWMWIDSDDTIEGVEFLPSIVNYMVTRELDMVMFMYEYGHGVQHWRERIIRNDSSLTWTDTPVHESVDMTRRRVERIEDITIKHHKMAEARPGTVTRNQKILEADWAKHKDPRTAFYLGMTYDLQQHFEQALEMFRFTIDNGPLDEQKLLAWLYTGDCYYATQQFDKAIDATNMAIDIDPSFPDPWYLKAISCGVLGEYEKARQFVEIAMTMKEREHNHPIYTVTQTMYKYEGLFVAAQAYLYGGNIEKAYELYQEIMRDSPQVIEQQNIDGRNWNSIFDNAYHDTEAIKHVANLSKYLRENNGDAQKLLLALPQKLYNDPRLKAERTAVFPPQQWPSKSIAYFVGPMYEPWGPDTLDQGMSGSEEAVVYLSRELVKLGWEVTVFCERTEPYADIVGSHTKPITYKPWKEFNPFDNFDVFVSSRWPGNVKGINARVKVVDLHDTMPEDSLRSIEQEVDKIFVKSHYHRSLYPNVPDDKFVVVGNAIVKEQFHEA